MKRTRNGVYLLAVLAISLLATLPAMAQHQQHHRTPERDSSHSRMEGMQHGDMQGTMTGGMMQGQMENMQRMMSSKLHRTLMMAYVLPTMGEALSLSGDQVSRLAELKQSSAKDERIARVKLASAQKSLGESVTSLGDAEKVRAAMRTRASLSADLQVLTYNSALRMLAVLSAEQRDHVENMKPMQLHHHMMSSMKNDEMSEVMESVMLGSIDCPMMSGNMMTGEMGSKVDGSGSD